MSLALGSVRGRGRPDGVPVLWFYRLAQVVLWILYRFFFQIEVHGSVGVPNDGRGTILAPNHASYLDPPILGISLEKPVSYLAKEYLFKVFILKSLLRALGVLPVKSEREGFRSLRQILRLLKEGRQVVVFPEGTRTRDGGFQSAEGGVGFLALKSEAHVVPVYIRGSFEAWPKGRDFFKCRPIAVFFGKSFTPSTQPDLCEAGGAGYQAVADRIMSEIKRIKEEVGSCHKPK